MGSVQLVELLLPGQSGSVALPPSVNPWTFMQMVEQVRFSDTPAQRMPKHDHPSCTGPKLRC